MHVPNFFSGGPSSTVEEILNGWDAFLDGDALVQIRGYRLLDDAKREHRILMNYDCTFD